MWMLAWAQRGAMIGFWLVGFLLIATLFLPFFACLFALVAKLITGFSDDEDDVVYEYEDVEDEGTEDNGEEKHDELDD